MATLQHEKHAERAETLLELLTEQVDEGRSTPGVSQSNDAKIVIEKKPKAAEK